MIHRTITQKLCLLVAAVAMLSATGCHGSGGGGMSIGGYTTGEQFDTSHRSVSVPIFDNKSFSRETEFRLTEALTKEIEARTPYKVTRRGAADTILTGTILSVNHRLISRETESGLPQEVQVIVTVSFEWKDLRTGKIIRQRSRFVGTGEFIPTRPVGEPVEVAKLAAVQSLAREIVSVMRKDW